MTPGLSVVLPVHNGRPFLDDAIASILRQTYADFELVILDDGSTDGTAADLARWSARDPRIRVATNPSPTGLVASAQAVVEHADAPLVARMDADDISRADRLERQVNLLAREPDTVLVGSLWEGIDPRGRRVRPRDRASLLRQAPSAPFPHGSVVFRREAFDQVGGYRTGTEGWEDLDLFLRLRSAGRLLVVPEALYRYRFHDSTGVAAVERMWPGMVASLSAYGGSCAAGRVGALSYLGQLRLWSGRRPGVLSGMLAAVDGPPDRATIRAILLAAAGAAAPTTVRRLLSWATVRRDAAATRQGIGGEEAHEWRFGPSS